MGAAIFGAASGAAWQAGNGLFEDHQKTFMDIMINHHWIMIND